MEIIRVNLWITRRFRYNLEGYKEVIAHQLLVLTLQKTNVKLPSSQDYKARQLSFKECLPSKWWSNQDITISWDLSITQNNSLRPSKQKLMRGLELLSMVEETTKRTYIYLIYRHLLTQPTLAWCTEMDFLKFNSIKTHHSKWIIVGEVWM